MSVLNVALIGSDELARKLGKKGDSRDIDSYVHKESKDGGSGSCPPQATEAPREHQAAAQRTRCCQGRIAGIGALDAPVGEAMVALVQWDLYGQRKDRSQRRRVDRPETSEGDADQAASQDGR